MFQRKVSQVAQPAYGYLMSYFTGEQYQNGEQIYFALSRDGLHFTALHDNTPVITNQLGTHGARDPFLFRTQAGDYVLLATDLRMYGHTEPGAWTRAEVAGSDQLLVWHSKDLVTWDQGESVTLGPHFGCVWAPEAIFDPDHGDDRLFWSATDTTENPKKLRIYSAHTKDFRHFTTPKVYLSDVTFDVIDLDVVAADDGFYRFWKLNQRGQVVMDRVQHLDDVAGHPIASTYLANMQRVEGPQAYQLPDGRWSLLLDQVNNDVRAYVPALTEDLASGQFTQPSAATYQLPDRPRHGSVLPIDQAGYARLIKRWQ
ncbi:glycoside hydrolase family 43 protein [Lacticaseibacillus parahuelsenbergensis]|uniref:Glycoside hydrolase family 43 protein n=1 Tax=Lacticaseibacillus parahuelsenbergensis TaxID=3068305 RepID=A0ABY9L303_9LACO|nr:glycoside hydrolase family 43 protein [Lacticaseibacillus sp. NCIMB 15471]WLV78116.1 glycoside hydrolase family 43 protein [Lacticaseibacillus sp. NCIMB 15471]